MGTGVRPSRLSRDDCLLDLRFSGWRNLPHSKKVVTLARCQGARPVQQGRDCSRFAHGGRMGASRVAKDKKGDPWLGLMD